MGGGFLLLPCPDPAYSPAIAVNYSGQVVGSYMTTTGFPGAFSGKGEEQKSHPPQSRPAVSTGRARWWVGQQNAATRFAFLWDPNLGLLNLNELLIPPQPGWNLAEAIGINGNMQIIGTGTYQGVDHAFLLDRVGTRVTEMVNLLL